MASQDRMAGESRASCAEVTVLTLKSPDCSRKSLCYFKETLLIINIEDGDHRFDTDRWIIYRRVR